MKDIPHAVAESEVLIGLRKLLRDIPHAVAVSDVLIGLHKDFPRE